MLTTELLFLRSSISLPRNLLQSHRRYISLRSMEGIQFDNLALRTLPIDPVEENYVRSVSGACFSRVNLFVSKCLWDDWFIDKGETNSSEKSEAGGLFARCSEANRCWRKCREGSRSIRRNLWSIRFSQDERQLAQVFSGNVLLPGMDPAAHCKYSEYSGFYSISSDDSMFTRGRKLEPETVSLYSRLLWPSIRLFQWSIRRR